MAAPAAGPTKNPNPQHTFMAPSTMPCGSPTSSAPAAASGKATAYWPEMLGVPTM